MYFLLKVNACWQAGIGHVVFSTLEDPRTLIPKGAMPELSKQPGRVVAHFESKAAVLVCSFMRCHKGMQICKLLWLGGRHHSMSLVGELHEDPA